jgi:hypothetical protein
LRFAIHPWKLNSKRREDGSSQKLSSFLFNFLFVTVLNCSIADWLLLHAHLSLALGSVTIDIWIDRPPENLRSHSRLRSFITAVDCSLLIHWISVGTAKLTHCRVGFTILLLLFAFPFLLYYVTFVPISFVSRLLRCSSNSSGCRSWSRCP